MTSRVDASDLTVVIPTRDRWPILRRTLAALDSQTATGFRTVVVVDGDDQDVPADISAGAAEVVVEPHGGPGAARNHGVARCTTPLVLLLGDDMVPAPGLVAAHLARHRAEPDDRVAVLGLSDWHPDVPATPLRRWIDRSASQFDYGAIAGDTAAWAHLYSCNVSLKRSLYDEVGGFDQRFRYYYEDLDMGWRLGQAGMVLRYEPAARAGHVHRYDLPAWERRFRGIGVGERTMAAKHPWFTPFFKERVDRAAAVPPVKPVWPLLVDRVPRSLGPLRARAETGADLWYHQRLAGPLHDGWEGERDRAELEAYLGEAYDDRLLREHEHLLDEEERAASDEAAFYRSSRMYLYDLTVFAMSGTKRPYLDDLRATVAPGARLLDYGCGIGADGLRLLEAGYRVELADFANPSTEYLRWRLGRRGLDAPVHDLDGQVPGGFDLAYAFDVIEHVDDPWAFLAELESRAALVCVNLLEPVPGDTHLHRPLPIPAILDHADRHGLVRYRRHHGRSHLVVYRTAGPARRSPWRRRGEPALAGLRAQVHDAVAQRVGRA